jgi:hypothetical protein
MELQSFEKPYLAEFIKLGDWGTVIEYYIICTRYHR